MTFATIGSNFIVHRFALAAKLHDNLAYGAVYSRSQDTGQELADQYGVAKVYTSLEALALDPDIDFVYVASPNAVHAEQSILMMKHGKHVLCEKPITSHARELEEMERVARENNVMLMEAMKSVYCPGYEAVRTNLHKLGPVRNVTLNFLQYTPCYEAYQKGMATNQFNPALSNCALVDTGVYTIHMLLALFGKPKKFQANAIMLSNGMDAAGTISCVYDDFLATLIYSKLATYEGNQIQGEQAAMIIDKISDIKHITIKYRDDREDEIIPIKKHPVMYYEIGVFLEAIKKGEQGDLLKISKLQMAFLDEARTQLGIVFPADNK